MGIRRYDNNYDIEKEISSLSEYIEFIKQEKNSYNGELWFRGQRDSSWALEPSLFRNEEFSITDSEIVILRRKLRLDFIKELKLFKSYLGIKDERYNDFHYMFLGQHYNLQTPALDWTTDPLVALFFALYKFREGNSPLVFILHPEVINRYSRIVLNKSGRILKPMNIDHINNANEELASWYADDKNDTIFTWTPLAVKSDYVKALSQRISRQSGVFTMMSPVPKLSKPWINLSFKEDGRIISYGKVVSINSSKVEEILSDLKALDIYEDTIMLEDTEEIEKKCKEAICKATKKENKKSNNKICVMCLMIFILLIYFIVCLR